MSKKFYLATRKNIEHFKSKSELSLSLEVILHLVEDEVFNRYMNDLFDLSTKYVIIYSNNIIKKSKNSHVKYRKFTEWIEKNRPNWELINVIQNDDGKSDTHLFFFKKRI